MFKTMFCAAFAAISICAFAQDKWDDVSRDSINASGKSHYEIKKEVLKQDQWLSGGDAFDFESMLDRMNGTAENALVSGLFCAHRQSVLIRDQKIASMYPTCPLVVAVQTNEQTILAEETDGSMRPLRLVIEDKKPMDIDYETAFDIITVDLSTTQVTQLSNWWDNEATDHQKDIIVRMLKNDAKWANSPVLPCLYTTTTFGQVNP